jgi:leader peptidase (prepilin peptidase)/N-methyltransferase
MRYWRHGAAAAASAAACAVLAARGTPPAAWWLLATLGAALAVTDIASYRLPTQLMLPLAAAELIALGSAAIITAQPGHIVTALLAAIVVGGLWLIGALAAPNSVGLGDVYLVTIVAGLLGWDGWSAVITGQLASWLLAGVTGILITALNRDTSPARTQPAAIPMGPALVLGALLACWL